MNDVNLNQYTDELQIIWDALVKRDDMPVHADAIVVGGECDLGLAERAAELYHSGVSGLIVLTGYQPKTLNMTEAKYLANRCLELGVPRNALVLEEEASNTGDNIIFSAKLVTMLKRDVKAVIFGTQTLHEPSFFCYRSSPMA